MAENKVKPFTGEKALSDIFLVEGLVPPDRLDTQAGSEVQKYSLISRNPIVKTALDIVESGVFWPNYSVKGNPQNDYKENPEYEELDNDIISLVNNQLDNVGIDNKTAPNVQKTPKFISSIKSLARKARIYGFSISELVWNSRDGIWWLDKIKPKPSWNFDYNIDESDELEAVVYYRTLETIEPERFLIGVWPRLEDGNYYGVSDLQCIEDEVTDLEDLEKKIKKGTSWNAFRPLVCHVDSKVGTKEQQRNKEILKGLHGSVTATFPMIRDVDMKAQKAYLFEMLGDRASESAIQYGWALINEYIKRINRALGVPDELGQVTVVAGSYAKAQTQFTVFIATIEKIQNWVEELVNRLIQTIIFYNYSNLPKEYKLPIWGFDQVEESYNELASIYFKNLIDAGVISADEQFIREALEIPPKPNEASTSEGEVGDSEIQTGEIEQMTPAGTEINKELDSINGDTRTDRAIRTAYETAKALRGEKVESTTVQSLIFDKEKFTRESAIQWAKDNNYKYNKIDETESSFRIRQKSPGDFQEGSFRAIQLKPGVSAIIGKLKTKSFLRKFFRGKG